MAITFITGIAAGGNPTTSFSIASGTLVQTGDLMVLEFTHRGTGDGTVSDNSGDGVAWTRKGEALFASNAFTVQHYYKRATPAFNGSSNTISVSGLTNSCAGVLTVYRDVIASGDPFEAWTAEANASGDESHAAITTLTDGAWVALAIGNSPDLTVTPTTPLVERIQKLSTGGTDSSICHASFEQATAGSSGALGWAQTNAASGTIAYAITPATLQSYTLAADGTTFTETGTTASLKRHARVAGATASYAINGTAASLERAAKLVSSGGSYVFTGTDASFRVGITLTADGASYILAGTAATFARDLRLASSAGSYIWTGSVAGLGPGYRVFGNSATFTLTGVDANLSTGGGLFVRAPAGRVLYVVPANCYTGNILRTTSGVIYLVPGEDLSTGSVKTTVGIITLAGSTDNI